MPRPPKPSSERLRCLLRFRCTEAERARIFARAQEAGLRPSTYLRRVGAEGKLLPPDPLVSLVAALNRAGNNVNQQMAIAHTKGEIPPLLLRLNAELETAVHAVLEKLTPTL